MKLFFLFPVLFNITSCLSSPNTSQHNIVQSKPNTSQHNVVQSNVAQPNETQFVYTENLELENLPFLDFDNYSLWWQFNFKETGRQKNYFEGSYTYLGVITHITIEYKDTSILLTFSDPKMYGPMSLDNKYYNTLLLPEWKRLAARISENISSQIEFNKSAEEAKNMLSEKENTARGLSSPILILRSNSGVPNSAGGVDVDIFFKNISDKRIKYIYFTVVPYNRVDDIVRSEIGEKSSAILEQVGYIEPNDFSEDNKVWGNVWYNSTIAYMKITKIETIFEDNSKMAIDDTNIIDNITLSIADYSYWNKYYYRDGR
jgi:hypothetical protein